ncbi:MAG TPA: NAD(P)H-dependent glycerol-3-phosphate dehydrogenase [Thermoanaerobaculia bacterium]|nr:NAD(P)H-dependent glycerol-3-phosphate dehydrogenase [Thermoanaerobaculia bacterium]
MIGILGAGSWGTALAVHAARRGQPVRLWARQEGLAERMRSERLNPYLPGVELPPEIAPTAEMEDLVGCDLVLLVVPSHGFRGALRQLLALWPRERPLALVSGAKGVETDTLARMSQVAFEEGMAADREVRFAVLSGPSFAAEVARGVPTAVVVAAEDGELAREVRAALACGTLRLYSSPDVVGVELGGAAKNVIAIAAGAAAGLGLGHNTLAALITRGLHEITRLGIAYGGQARTFAGLAGLGDLVLTCTGGLSRNRRTGEELAAGRTLAEIQEGTPFVAEGVRSALAISRLAAARGVEMPITQQMAAVMYDGKDPRRAVEELMTREPKSEAEI